MVEEYQLLMRKFLFIVLTGCLLLAVACNHGFSEKDLVGKWIRDPQAKNGSNYPDLEKQLYYTVTDDHKFALNAPNGLSVEGTWSYDEDHNEVVFSPDSVVVPLPGGAPTKQPIAQAIATMQANNAPPAAIQGLQNATNPVHLRPSDDGKKLLDNGEPEFDKAGS
jgi:hypothetical protein